MTVSVSAGDRSVSSGAPLQTDRRVTRLAGPHVRAGGCENSRARQCNFRVDTRDPVTPGVSRPDIVDSALTITFTGHCCIFRVEAARIASLLCHCLRKGEDIRLNALDIVVHGFHVLGDVVSGMILVEVLMDQKAECRAVSFIQVRLILVEQPCCLRVGDFQVGWRERARATHLG